MKSKSKKTKAAAINIEEDLYERIIDVCNFVGISFSKLMRDLIIKTLTTEYPDLDKKLTALREERKKIKHDPLTSQPI